MEPASILVAALTAGVIALLVWLEVNSRRNEPRTKSQLDQVRQSEQDRERRARAETDDRKAA